MRQEASGVPWNFSPVLDLGRQPIWSRFFETLGEDVYLSKTMGKKLLKGIREIFPLINIMYHVLNIMLVIVFQKLVVTEHLANPGKNYGRIVFTTI